MEQRQSHGKLEYGTSLQLCPKSRQGTWSLSPSNISHWTWMPWEEGGFPRTKYLPLARAANPLGSGGQECHNSLTCIEGWMAQYPAQSPRPKRGEKAVKNLDLTKVENLG